MRDLTDVQERLLVLLLDLLEARGHEMIYTPAPAVWARIRNVGAVVLGRDGKRSIVAFTPDGERHARALRDRGVT